MSNLTWKEAIIQVMKAAGKPMHYLEITKEIAKLELVETRGATPARTVSNILTKNESDFVSIEEGSGIYILRNNVSQISQSPFIATPTKDFSKPSLINSFGMYWKRDKVIWSSSPDLFGKQQEATMYVNFRNQIGIYILYDNNGIVYIGRSEQTISKRLKDHTEDRLEGRWDRFSWFGIYSVNEDGSLNSPVNNLIDIENLIITFESLLIEVIEPRQNRKRGDYFSAIEFLQTDALPQ